MMQHSLERNLKPYSKAIVKLLRGTIESRSKEWDNVVTYQHEIQEYINTIGLELIIKKEEGFAFVKQFEDSEGNTTGLVVRRQMGFEVSILLVILRQLLEEFDSNPSQYQSLDRFITDVEIKEEVELFLPEKYDRVKFIKDLDSYIKKVVDLGYLKEMRKKENEVQYKIHRIIKEKVTLDILKEFKQKLESYVESV